MGWVSEMDNELSPQEVLARLHMLVEEHPNARIVANVPGVDGAYLDYALCPISNVFYEPSLTFVRDEGGEVFDVYYSKDDFFADYGEEPVCDFDFGEYIIVCCDRK